MFYFVTRVTYFEGVFVKKFLENLDSIEKKFSMFYLIACTVPDAINRPKHAWKGDYNTGNTRAQILTRGWSRVIIPELTQSHRPVLCTIHITACDRVWARVIIGQKPQHHRSIIGIVASSSWSTPIKYYQLAMWSTWVEFLLCNVQWVEFSVTHGCAGTTIKVNMFRTWTWMFHYLNDWTWIFHHAYLIDTIQFRTTRCSPGLNHWHCINFQHRITFLLFSVIISSSLYFAAHEYMYYSAPCYSKESVFQFRKSYRNHKKSRETQQTWQMSDPLAYTISIIPSRNFSVPVDKIRTRNVEQVPEYSCLYWCCYHVFCLFYFPW